MKEIKIRVVAVLLVALIGAITFETVYGTPIGQLTNVMSSISKRITPSGGVKSSERKGLCGKVECEKPPSKSNCTVVEKNDTSVTHPEGGKAECCPLWKCHDRHKSSSFFTFHGIIGEGSETVKYTQSRTGRKGSKNNATNIVTSIATGSHNAEAVAGEVDEDLTAMYMKEMSKSFSKFGITI